MLLCSPWGVLAWFVLACAGTRTSSLSSHFHAQVDEVVPLCRQNVPRMKTIDVDCPVQEHSQGPRRHGAHPSLVMTAQTMPGA